MAPDGVGGGRRLEAPARSSAGPHPMWTEYDMTHPTASPTTWFVTGTSRGLGLELVRRLLQRGDQVTATTRSTERLTSVLEGADTSRLLALEVDLVDQQQVVAAVAATRDRF